VGGQEVGKRIPVFDPERYVVKRFDSHTGTLPAPVRTEAFSPAFVPKGDTYNRGFRLRGEHMLSFGVTVLPDPPHARLVELVQVAERQGFDYGWTYDSHILWQEGMVLLTLMALSTERLKLGHCVTNPGTREPTVVASAYATLQDVSGGRMVVGIGRGDSARRVIGYKPVPIAEFERSCALIRDLANGRSVSWNGKEFALEWARGMAPIPLHVAGYGPRALAVAGRVADGVIIQLADPVIVEWIMAQARAAAEEAGRDPDVLECIVCAPSHVSDDLADARNQVRWFPAMVSNHVMDLIERYGDSPDIPSELTEYVKARKFYDYRDHSRVGAAHGEFVTDEICDRFCVIGSAEQIKAKLRHLEAIGVDQWNIYLMTHGQEETLAAYGREIIPELKAGAA
jgi:probable F420-dependent oxidoreductase